MNGTTRGAHRPGYLSEEVAECFCVKWHLDINYEPFEQWAGKKMKSGLRGRGSHSIGDTVTEMCLWRYSRVRKGRPAGIRARDEVGLT
jgi:hypothetical protein